MLALVLPGSVEHGLLASVRVKHLMLVVMKFSKAKMALLEPQKPMLSLHLPERT
jgi:hypothetical protein